MSKTPLEPSTLSMAAQARTLVYRASVGSLSTLSEKHPDWPFGSVMPYSLDSEGQPTFLISAMAMHTRNLKRDGRASLLVTSESILDPLGTARITLMGRAKMVPAAELTQVRSTYLTRHPDAAGWVNFNDFGFYHLVITDTYYVGGFGVMGWITATDYAQAEVDPLADLATGIIDHMNTDHAESLVKLARHFATVPAEEGTMTAVDHLGFNLQVVADDAAHHLRIEFPQPVLDGQAAREVLTDMVRQARECQANP